MRILIVEDDPTLGRVLILGLAAHHYSVDLATTGMDALRSLSYRPVDVILLDIGLPDMEGWDVLRALSPEQRRSTAVIVISVSAVQPSKVREQGLAGALQKPFAMQALLQAIDHAMSGAVAIPSTLPS